MVATLTSILLLLSASPLSVDAPAACTLSSCAAGQVRVCVGAEATMVCWCQKPMEKVQPGTGVFQ